ncbi:MAG: porin family protein [Bacteroidota bacterium]
MMLSTWKKVSLLIWTAGIFTTTVNAQIQFGVKGGFNIAELLTSSNQSVIVNNERMGIRNFPRTDVYGGFLLSVPLFKKFIFQPEVVYSQQGATGNPSGGALVSAIEKYKLNYVNIPLLIKYNLPVGFYVETGPQVGYLLSAKVDEQLVGGVNTGKYFHVKDQFKSTDIAWVLGVGYLSPIDLGFDIRYNLSLSSINNASASDMQSAPVQGGSIKNSVVQIGIFYLFGKSKNKTAFKAAEGS